MYEEGVLFRVFSGFISAPPLRASARYQLRDDIADGLVHVEKGVINAFIIGGGLPEGDSLWRELTRIDYGIGQLLPGEIQPVPERWLVPILQMYGLADTSVMVTSPCGPATVDFPLLVYRAAASTEAHVIMQQASGIVQVDGQTKFATPPRALGSMAWNLADVN